MPAPIVIEITPRGRAVIAKLQRFPQDMGNAIKRGMDDAGLTAWRDIDRTRFSGKGPFPPILRRLGQKTERTKLGLMWKPAKVDVSGGNRVSVTGTMGVFGVKYFALHEQGSLKFPKRAPLRTGLESHKINFRRKIEAELEKEWAKK